uniref:Dynamin-type G domain-containing protein n=1 Tax=Macrostomum lignano TaxID=282301 RepID=A0A1I8G586_9PLAT
FQAMSGTPLRQQMSFAGGGATAPGSDPRAGASAEVAAFRRKSTQHASLKQFRQVKEEINQVYAQISAYIDECLEFFNSDCSANTPGAIGDAASVKVEEACFSRILTPAAVQSVTDFRAKVRGIREVISRNQMKCAFFGRTSNGKSTVINAMLGRKVLPSGIGHTTNCFLQVEGTSKQSAYLQTPNSSEEQPIESVSQLGSALSNEKMDCESLVRVFWPKQLCSLLREDVVLLDSPGVDVSPDLDTWIDQFCMDADVFILVCNSESTLMNTEKKFFHKVGSKLSKPNVFVLNNRWDCSDGELDSAELVRKQHMDKSVSFLADELKSCTRSEAESRVYFVSAKEALVNRLKETNQGLESPSPAGSLADGWQSRYFDFKNFEREFELILSESAIRTKFAAHAEQGRHIAGQMFSILEAVYEGSVEEKDSAVAASTERDIRQTLEGIERKVAGTLSEEIRRLVEIVDDFDRPFHPDSMSLVVYKKELNEHVERTLGLRLTENCARQLAKEVRRGLTAMQDRYTALVGQETRQRMQAHVQPGLAHWEPAFHIDCRNICADFREDIEFRFSLSPTALLARLQGRKPHESQQATGWRVLAVCGAVYGGLYLYERLTWTGRARERLFKRQYVDYATAKLRLIVDLTSSNASHQVRQELVMCQKKLLHEVESEEASKMSEAERLERLIRRLEEVCSTAKRLKNQAAFLDKTLANFHQTHILQDRQE